MADLHQLLKLMVAKEASDLHLTCGTPPHLRIDGHLVPLRSSPLTAEDTRRLCYSFLKETQRETFNKNHELDLSFGVKDLCRFRVNIFMQRGTVAGAFRVIPNAIAQLRRLGLPSVVGELTSRARGLIW